MPSHWSRLRQWNIDIDRYLNPFIPPNQSKRLPRPVAHFLGHRQAPQKDVGNVLLAVWSCVGGFISIILMEAVFMIPGIRAINPPLMIASFGAAAILQFNTIASPLAQPRNAILGEFLATALGIAITKLFLLLPHSKPDPTGPSTQSAASPPGSLTFEDLRFLAGALSVGLSSTLMTLTKTVYPPAGATALLAAIDPRCTDLGWWLLPLAMLSTAVNLVVGLVVNNLQRRWPVWWWTDRELSRNKQDGDGAADVPVVQGVEPAPQTLSSEKRVSETSTITVASKEANERIRYEKRISAGRLRKGVEINRDGILLPEGLDISEQEREMLSELRRRMRIISMAEVKKVHGDDNV